MKGADESALEGSWVLVEEGDLKGFTLIADVNTGDIVCLSARQCNDENRRSYIPTLKDYPTLRVVDLHGYRYMRSLDSSIGDLQCLERLVLTKCDLLTKLPSSIGNLHSLQEVCENVQGMS